MQLLNTRQAAGLLEVSEATVRNWVRHGYITPVVGNAGRFLAADIEGLKQRITVGELDRLRRRANKKRAGNSCVPTEYLDNPAFSHELADIQRIFLEETLDINQAMYALALKQLVLRGELADAGARLFTTVCRCESRRKPLTDELATWRQELLPLSVSARNACSRLFDALTDAAHEDTLGIIYQSLMQAGSKAYKGSFYTPAVLIDDIFNEHAGPAGAFLDPCCGTGQFLLRAARHGYDPGRLYGIDSDLLAVRIARINLLLAFPGRDFAPQIYHADAMLQNIETSFCDVSGFNRQFALIASNPPWGASFTGDQLQRLRQRFPAVKSGESFSFFLARSLELAASGAVISFILPEAFLNIRAHSDIRRHILANTQILAVHSLDRPFKSVFTQTIRLDLRKDKPVAGSSIRLKNCGSLEKRVSQAGFANNNNSIFTISISEDEYRIIDKIYSLPHRTLRDNADWALGIVTGDNRRHVANTAEPGMEPVYRGSDVMPYCLRPATSHIRFDPSVFQQVAPVTRYRAPEKLIYRFIANRLTFAYDDRQSLTLNSANILIPRLADYPIRAILCLLNSKLLQFVFARKFNTRKVLRGDLEQLPLPVMSEKVLRRLELLAGHAISGEAVAQAIDAVIFDALQLTRAEIDLILSGIALE